MKTNEIPVIKDVEFLPTGRNHNPKRHKWNDTVKQMEDGGCVLISKQAISSISTAAKRLGHKIKSQEKDPYHCWVKLEGKVEAESKEVELSLSELADKISTI